MRPIALGDVCCEVTTTPPTDQMSHRIYLSDDAEVGVSDPLRLLRVKDPDIQKRRIRNIRRYR